MKNSLTILRIATGDAHPSQAASMVAFANYDFVKHNIDRTATQFNVLKSYSLYWVLSLLDYYRYTGDAATFQHYIPNVKAKLTDYLTEMDASYPEMSSKVGGKYSTIALPTSKKNVRGEQKK